MWRGAPNRREVSDSSEWLLSSVPSSRTNQIATTSSSDSFQKRWGTFDANEIESPGERTASSYPT